MAGARPFGTPVRSGVPASAVGLAGLGSAASSPPPPNGAHVVPQEPGVLTVSSGGPHAIPLHN